MISREDFLHIIHEHRALIYKVAAVYTNNKADREDLIQEIYYQLWKSIGTFKEQAAISTWIYRVAMNVAIYQLKTSKRRIQPQELSDDHLEISTTLQTETEEQWQQLHRLIETLNLLDKGIVLLYLENKSHEEIAQLTGITVSNVGTRLSRIKEKWRQRKG